MSPRALTRAFERILAVTLPVPAAVFAAACSSTSTTGPSDAGGDQTFASSSGSSCGGSVSSGSSGSSTTGNSTGSTSSGSSTGSSTGGSTGSTSSTGGSGGGGCYPGFCSSGGSFEQFYVDSGTLDDAGMLIVNCATACGDSAPWTCRTCREPMDWMICCSYCPPNAGACGRRPGGLLSGGVARGTPAGAYFASMARLEAASVHAFRHLRRELLAHKAPRRLVRAAERAARDEVRHARAASALARRCGGVAIPAEVAPCRVRTLEAMAVENVVEGCVREAFGALVAHWQSASARDPVIRAAMKRIARDETRHAALAFEVDAWAQGRLDGPARERVATARARASEDLLSDSTQPPPPLCQQLGLPTRRQRRALAAKLALL